MTHTSIWDLIEFILCKIYFLFKRKLNQKAQMSKENGLERNIGSPKINIGPVHHPIGPNIFFISRFLLSIKIK